MLLKAGLVILLIIKRIGILMCQTTISEQASSASYRLSAISYTKVHRNSSSALCLKRI